MTPDRATLNFLNSFSSTRRREAERLQEAGCVTQIFGDHRNIQGRVEDAGMVCRPSIKLRGDDWIGDCSCAYGERCTSVASVMLERLARDGDLPEAPNEIGDQPITEILEEKLGREMIAREDEYLEKLERRYRRYETEGQLFDTDLVRLNPRWPVDSYEPITLWPVPPANIVEFWNYIAWHFRNRNLAYPLFLESITDFAAVENTLREWEREQAEEQWKKKVFSFEEPDPTPARSAAFRLLITTGEARLQVLEEGNEKFQTLQQESDLAPWKALYAEGRLRMDDASGLIWESFTSSIAGTEAYSMRLEHESQAVALNRLFFLEQARDSLVNLDERVIELSDRPVKWNCDEESDEEGMARLQLAFADGEPIPHFMRLLPGRPNLYLGDEAAYPGPDFWEDSTEVLPSYDIPRRVLWSEPGVAFLHGVKAEMPDTLKDRIKPAQMKARMDMRLNQKLTGAESEHLLIEVEARDAEDTRKEELEKEGWIVAERRDSPEGVIYRYERDELRLIPDLLNDMGMTWDQPRKCFRTRVTRSFPEKFVEWLETLPETLEIETDEHLGTLLADPVKASVTFDIVASEIDWFDLKIVIDVEGLDLSMQEIRSLVAARGGFVRMKDGGWLKLKIDLTEQQAEAVSKLGLDPFDLSGETHRMHVLQLSEPIAKEVFDEQAWELICDRAASLKLRVSPAVPEVLDCTLRPYQVEGFHFLSYLSSNGFGGILADDMGLGKTVQSITWLLWLRSKHEEPPPALVVCPKSVLDVWAEEMRKFAPHLRVQILRNKFDLDIEKVQTDVDILVLNYSQLRVNSEVLDKQKWLAMVLDEGQQIKNPDSKAAKAARQMSAENRLVLTGTPIENRLLDIWSLMAFAMPGVLGTRKYFRDRFDRRKDPRCQERLSARLRPFLLRRTKGQVAVDLPPRTEEDVFCNMEDVQREIYDDEMQRIQNVLLGMKSDDELNKNRFTVLQGLTRLRQICCHPALYDRDMAEEESAKFTALFYLLDQLREEGHKVLVFSQFVTMLEIIKKRLEEEKRPWVMLTGQTKDRQKVVETFQTSEEPTCFLLSLKAGGSGLNLTAASYVVLYDPWWNPAVENQAIDRTHRIGQTNKVIAYRLLMRNSVEEKIRVLQKQKEAVSSGVLGEEGFANSLTRDDLKYLFATGEESERLSD